MNANQLNVKVLQYKQLSYEEDFNTIYVELVSSCLSAGKLTRICNALNTEQNEVYEIFHDTVIDSVRLYTEDKGNFINYFRFSFKNNQREFLRNKTTRFKYEGFYDDFEDDGENGNGDTAISRIPDTISVEETVIRKTDQRQLIGFLDHICDRDETMTAIIETSMRYEPEATSVGRPKSIEAFIGSELGIDKRRIKRIFKRLASVFEDHGMTLDSFA